MQSLRTRRPQAPAPSSRPQRTKLAKPGSGPTPRNINSRKSRVDDKIKKRMSMRYADISSPTEFNIPPMPTLPENIGRDMYLQDDVATSKVKTVEAAKAIADDNAILDDEQFDPDSYLKIKLANSTEAELKSLQSSLRDAKDDTASDLQRNVFKNYAEFVLISKEISTLENEMLELKESLSEFKSMPSLLHIPDPTSTSSSTLSQYKRSSVADLRIMYYNQMQSLHSQIEGSAQFVPIIPGRHIIGEVNGLLALNSATYKVIGKVKFVVLDDAVLFAKRRRRNAAGGDSSRSGSIGEGKLVAEKCWPLNEMLVLDTKDSPSMTNVFKIRHGKETYVFRAETTSEKKNLLHQLRHAADELAAKKRKEREGEHERRKSLWNAGDRASALNPDRFPDYLADLARKADEIPGSEAKEKAEKDVQWANGWGDDLTVAVALKQWEKAAMLVEEGNAKQATNAALAAKLPVLTTELIDSLLECLSLPSNRKTTTVFLISLLVRLNAGPAARATFLDMRSQVMKNHIRKIRFEGHVGAFIGDLAVVCFTGIKHTADWFLASFKENEVASAFIEWAKNQLIDYCEMFRRQVYISDVESSVIDEAMKITYSQSKKLLEEFGLDFRYLLDELLVEHPKDHIHASVPFSFRDNHVVNPSPRLPISKSRSPVRAPPISIKVGDTDPLGRTDTNKLLPVSAVVPLSGYSSASAYTPATSNFFAQTFESPGPPSAMLRSRTPTSTSSAPSSGTTSAPTPTLPLASPLPRRNQTPPPSPLRSTSSTRERPPRVPRNGTASPAPPPRSTNRPGSSISHRPPPVAVPQRDGMI